MLFPTAISDPSPPLLPSNTRAISQMVFRLLMNFILYLSGKLLSAADTMETKERQENNYRNQCCRETRKCLKGCSLELAPPTGKKCNSFATVLHHLQAQTLLQFSHVCHLQATSVTAALCEGGSPSLSLILTLELFSLSLSLFRFLEVRTANMF